MRQKIKSNLVFMNEAKTICETRSNKALHRSSKSFADDESIKVCKFDKSKGVVILNSNTIIQNLTK